MREILFRGKREDTDEWIDGDLLTSTDIVNCTEIAENTGMGDRYDVIPETVGQYTGLTDRNGIRIFEGDVCKIGDFDLFYFAITFDKYGCWKFTTICNYYEIKPPFSPEFNLKCEVVGNIHDNPKLLGGDEQ